MCSEKKMKMVIGILRGSICAPPTPCVTFICLSVVDTKFSGQCTGAPVLCSSEGTDLCALYIAVMLIYQNNYLNYTNNT